MNAALAKRPRYRTNFTRARQGGCSMEAMAIEPSPAAVPRLNVPRRISRFALEQRSRLSDETHDGVRRLMWAILKDTLRCYQNYFEARSVQGQRLFRDASRWI